MKRDEVPVPADLELVRSRAASTTQQGQLLVHYSNRPDIGSPEPEQVLSRLRSRWNVAGGSWPLRLSFALASTALKRHLEGPCYDWFLGCNNQSTFDDALHLLYELGCATSGRPPTLGLKKPKQTREFARSFELLADLAVDHPDRLGQRFKWWDGGQVTAQIPLGKLGTSAVRPLIPSKLLDAWQSAPEVEWWVDLDCFHAIAVAVELVCATSLDAPWRSEILGGRDDETLGIEAAAGRARVSGTQVRRWRNKGLPTIRPPAGKERGEEVWLSDVLAWKRGLHPKQQQRTPSPLPGR